MSFAKGSNQFTEAIINGIPFQFIAQLKAELKVQP
jgi:hypothetical protein